MNSTRGAPSNCHIQQKMASDGEELEAAKRDLPRAEHQADATPHGVLSPSVEAAQTVNDVTDSSGSTTSDDESKTPTSAVESGERNDEADKKHQPDFSHLPELVWVKVIQLLPLADRYHLSQVNWFLNALFHDGDVWRTAVISFDKALVHGYFYMARYKLVLPERDKKLARKFGHFYRDVTLRVLGRPEEMEDDTRQILSSLQRSWRLESLTLDIGEREWGSRFLSGDSVNVSLLVEVVAMLRTSCQLRSLHVLTWPHSYLINEECLHLTQVLSVAECLKLRSLRFPRTSENGIKTVTSPTDMAVHAVRKFRYLRHLYVTSDTLGDALFNALVTSRDVPFESLSVEVSGLWSTGILEHLLSPLPWTTLTSHLPGLEVAMTISADVPEFALARFLVPDIPLVAITFDSNCHCYRKAFQLMHQYSHTLRSFGCLSEPQDCELPLMDMVLVCQKLQHLHFHGVVSDLMVVCLAGARGRRWGHFRFLWRNIEKTRQRPAPFNLVSRAQHAHLSTGLTEEEVKADLCQQVAEKLGFPWKPLVL